MDFKIKSYLNLLIYQLVEFGINLSQSTDSWSFIIPGIWCTRWAICCTRNLRKFYLGSMSLRSGLGLDVGVMSSLDGNAVRSSNGLGVLVQFCQGFWVLGPEDDGSLSGVERWLLWKGRVWVSSSRGTPTIRSCLIRGRRPCVDWLRGLEPKGGFPWLPVEDGGSRGDSSASKPVLS